MTQRAVSDTSPTKPAAQAALEIVAPDGNRRRIALRGERTSIGRLRSASVYLDDPSVSRQHADIYRDPFGRWWIRDLNSRFGTFVHGRRIHEQTLTGSEEIRIGEHRLYFHDVAPKTVTTDDDLRTLPVADEPACVVHTLPSTDVPRLASSQLAELLKLGAVLGAVADDAVRLQRICEYVTDSVREDCTALVLRLHTNAPDAEPQELARASSGLQQHVSLPYVSRTLLRKVLQTGDPALASNAPIGPVDAAISLSPTKLEMAAVACPLAPGDDVIDILYIIFPPHYGTSEWLAFASLIAAQYQQAASLRRMQERMQSHQIIERDLARAREIQTALLPETPALTGLDVAIGFEPCRWVGGDYADLVPLDDGRLLIVIGDVSGKGLSAALLTGNLHALVHAHLADDFRLDRMMQAMNKYLCRHMPDSSFVTLQCLLIDPQRGSYELLSAGHPPPVCLDPTNESLTELVAPANIPLGIEDIKFASQTGALPTGPWLMLYTDGATDIVNERNERLEVEGLHTLLRVLFLQQNADKPAVDMVASLNQALNRYQGTSLPADDRTFILLRRPWPTT